MKKHNERIKKLKQRDKALEVLLLKYGKQTANEWIKFLLIKHSKSEIVQMAYLDLFYPCWVEQIDYLCNEPDKFEEWHMNFKRNLLNELSSME